MITRKNAGQIALMRRAGKVVAEMHEVCIRAAKPGATTLDVDAVAREVLERRGAQSNFLGNAGRGRGRRHYQPCHAPLPRSGLVHSVLC